MFVSDYVELHCHSAYSFLDGASLPEDLIIRAKDLGYSSLALTDHDGVYGSMEFAQSALELKPFKAIHGAELTLVAGDSAIPITNGYKQWANFQHGGSRQVLKGWKVDPLTVRHVTVLVKNREGWANLCKLLTLAHSKTRDINGVASDPWLTVADLCAHSKGLICLSGCAALGINKPEELAVLRDAFGSDDLYVELQRPYLRGDKERIRHRLRVAKQLSLKYLATGNVHAHSKERALLQDAFVAVKNGLALDASEPLRRGNHTHVLASAAAMKSRFAELPEAIKETLEVADKINFDLTVDLGYRYPGSEDPQATDQLRQICDSLFAERYPTGNRHEREARERLESELQLIAKLNLSGFFALHHEIVEVAREVAHKVRGESSAKSFLPPGRGRGSSVSSIVCYLTGLSHCDPIENRLSLGRFLHDELVNSMPDIDLDFPRDIRAELIPELHRRYGHDRAALVATFPTYRARGSIRELGAALGLPPAELERVAKATDGWSGRNVLADISLALGTEPNKLPERWRWLSYLSGLANRLPRHLSQHPGGMVISTKPLIECCPVVPSAMAGRQMVMWDKDSCGDANFLKVDLLGLGMLSCVERTVELVWSTRGEKLDLSRIPLDDEQTFQKIKTGDTVGVFQIESRAQIGSLLRTKPATLDELTIQVAIVRPGPIQGGAVNPYIQRRQLLHKDPDFVPPYPHSSLEPVLKETLGTIIFQDQVIETAVHFAGFTITEAEGLRRAMSRKRSEEALQRHHQRFVEGAIAKHRDVTSGLAEQIWQMVKGFSGFGFPKAHSVAFGLLAYQSTWLKTHYQEEFLCALLDEQPMGFYSPDALVHDAMRHGVLVLPPDIQKSQVKCSIEQVSNTDGTEQRSVRIGLGYIIGVTDSELQRLVDERAAAGQWRSLKDLTSRTDIGLKALEKLAWSGALDQLAALEGVTPAKRRRAALWAVGALQIGKKVVGGTQLALPLTSSVPVQPARISKLGLGPEPAKTMLQQLSLQELDSWKQMIADYEMSGMTLGAHPLSLIRTELQAKGLITCQQINSSQHGQIVRIAGLVLARQRPGSAGGITFLLIEDETNTCNMVVKPQLYERRKLIVRTEPLVVITGRVERHASAGGQINVLVNQISRLDDLGIFDRPKNSPVALQSLRDQQFNAAERAADMRRVAPEVMNFGRGRSR